MAFKIGDLQFIFLQPLGILPKPSSSLSIAKSIAAGMGPEIRDDVAVSSPLAALTMSREAKKQGKFVNPCSVVEVWGALHLSS